MHPIERLRWIARAEGESPNLLAAEAAWTLAELASSEPAALLTAARRLLDRHPEAGPLWWVAAQLVAADDPYEAAHRAAGELHDDPAVGHLAKRLRADHAAGDVVVTASPVDVVREALAKARAYELRAVADPYELRGMIALLAAVSEDVSGWTSEEAPDAVEDASVALVEVLASSASIALVRPSGATVVESARHAGLALWAVVGVGRALPDRLATAAAERATARGSAVSLSPEQFTVAVGPSGKGEPAEVMAATTAPPGLELLHRVV